jgi:hypothetical protein
MCDCPSKVDGYSSLEDCLRTCRNFYLVREMPVPPELDSQIQESKYRTNETDSGPPRTWLHGLW